MVVWGGRDRVVVVGWGGGGGMPDSQLVSVLDSRGRDRGFKSRPGLTCHSTISQRHLRPLANSAMTTTLTIRCRWEGEATREMTGLLTSYAEVKKMKSLPLPIHGFPSQWLKALLTSSDTPENLFEFFMLHPLEEPT